MHSYRSTPEVALSSGDYEAYPAPTLPPVRVPVFARQAPHQDVPPPVWGWDPRNDPRALAAPVAPGSLAPVAMGQHSAATGSIRAVVTPEPEKSSTKWGVMIAVTGAILGGMLGIMMNNGALSASGPNPAVAAQNAMEAAQLPAAPQPVPQPMQSPAAQSPAQPAVQAPAQPAVQINTAPAAPAPAQHATKDEPKDKHEKKGHHHAAASTHHHTPAPAAPVARSHTKPIVAASVPDAPREKEKPIRKDREEKTEKKTEKSAETNAATEALKQASKETSLSLGGSK